MSIEVTCLQCNASHHVNDRMAGRRVRCPKCDTVVDVPELAQEEEILATELDEDLYATIEEGEPISSSPLSSSPQASAAEKLAAMTLTVVAPAVVASVDDDSNAATSDEDEDADEVLVRTKRKEEEMDMTPMVDVTFLLLIFFMVTAAFSLQKSIVMPRQQTDAPSSAPIEDIQDELDMVEIQVDEFGSFLVMAPDWERETPGKQNLISTLKEAMGANNDGMRLVIKVHEMAKLRALVDAMDAGTIAGYAQLEVTQVEDFD